jgi:hypothetical protein
MKYIRAYENKSSTFEVGDWVFLKMGVPLTSHLYDLVKNQPAQIESIKRITKDKIKYTLTYSKGWQKSFILWNRTQNTYLYPIAHITDYLRKAKPKEYKEFQEDMEMTKLRKDAKKYNL